MLRLTPVGADITVIRAMRRPTRSTKAKAPAPEPAKRAFEERFPLRESEAIKLLALNVKRLREKHRLNQVAFGELVGLDQSGVSVLENGRANVTIVQAERIAHALGVNFLDLFRHHAS